MNIHSEVFFVKIDKGLVFYTKKLIDVSKEVDNPDVFVRKLVDDYSAKFKAGLDKTIVHSTSWRCSHCGQIALTYLVYSDFFDFGFEKVGSFKVSDLTIKSSGKKDSPTPIKITEKDILSHGIRHFSFLVNGDPEQYKGAFKNSDISKFKKIDQALAGVYSKGGD